MKTVQQLIDKNNHLVEFITPCAQGKTLVRWFTDPDTLRAQQLLREDSANWIKEGLLRNNYHVT